MLRMGAHGDVFDNPYNFSHLTADFIPFNSPVPTGPWRSVEYPGTVFARESFIDEIAHAVAAIQSNFGLHSWSREMYSI